MEIKEQLKEDEKLLVSVFKLEKFFNKYKYFIIGFFVVIFVIFAGFKIKNYLHTQMLIKTNNALDRLLSNPDDKEALNTLKDNKELFNLYLLHKANTIQELNKIDSKQLEAIKEYKIAMLKGDENSLLNYLKKYSILSDSVRVALIRLYLSKNKRALAKEQFSKIPMDSDFYEISKYLMHYGIVK